VRPFRRLLGDYQLFPLHLTIARGGFQGDRDCWRNELEFAGRFGFSRRFNEAVYTHLRSIIWYEAGVRVDLNAYDEVNRLLIIIQNDSDVPVGDYGLYLAEEGVPFRTIRPYAGDVIPPCSEVSGVILLGGAMGVHDDERFPFLNRVKRAIREWVGAGIPYLGICLGGQLLADVCGGVVTSGSYGEKGIHSVVLSSAGKRDPLFAGVSGEIVTFQWHNDCFSVPEGGVLLASSPVCPGQAFRFGLNAYGFQFHPEVDRSIVALWAGETPETAPFIERYLDEFTCSEEKYRRVSRGILRNFLLLPRVKK
jgi:GMP synthase-like glutamine amidotransferase